MIKLLELDIKPGISYVQLRIRTGCYKMISGVDL